ncbi:MAG: hypothetical protein QXE06_06935 [Candidatus Bathyarchaeia archaeon]
MDVVPRCLDCALFDLKTCYCSWINAFIREESAKKCVPCDGFIRRYRRRVQRVEKHHAMPFGNLVRVKK